MKDLLKAVCKAKEHESDVILEYLSEGEYEFEVDTHRQYMAWVLAVRVLRNAELYVAARIDVTHPLTEHSEHHARNALQRLLREVHDGWDSDLWQPNPKALVLFGVGQRVRFKLDPEHEGTVAELVYATDGTVLYRVDWDCHQSTGVETLPNAAGDLLRVL
jgi:hypothetical protein